MGEIELLNVLIKVQELTVCARESTRLAKAVYIFLNLPLMPTIKSNIKSPILLDHFNELYREI